MASFSMPAARDFGWSLKPTDSTAFEIIERPNGQFCVVLNHSLLRGVSSEMIYWWFLNFPNLRVSLDGVPGYESQTVPGYLLWHPSDHCSADLSGPLGAGSTSRAGAKIHIREAMQYNKYALKYPVDTALSIFYCAPDGWAMGKRLPSLGKVMCLRIHFKDVVSAGQVIGVNYHYEVVIGATGNNPFVRAFNRRLTKEYSPEFFAAWHLHNAIEVGTFENFLPALFEQSGGDAVFRYAVEMNPMKTEIDPQSAHSPDLFLSRVEGYKSAKDPHAYQASESKSFL